MLFNSQFFIFIFLPLTLAGWYIINHFKKNNLALLFLTGMSLWFYGYFNPIYLVILVGSICINYLISFLMEKYKKASRILFFAGLIINIAVLGYYKYYDFFVDNINAVFGTSFALKHILLPLGISFFTLQQISFLIDRYWGTAPHYEFIYYAAYVAYFPQLIAGPIVLHNEIIPQYKDFSLRKFNKENFRDGTALFILGLIKKVLIADLFAYFVNYGFEKIYNLDTLSAWIVALAYTVELYFDFSGYCDMACGLGKLFNFELPSNFNSPYKSRSVPEYWSRWHITLTRFFNTYIYTPLTLHGMRRNKKRLYSFITPLVVFLISGFWHGASWTFVIWGLSFGVATIWCHRKFWKIGKKHKKLAWACTFIFTVIVEAVFRSETMENMVQIIKRMFTLTYNEFMVDIASALVYDPFFDNGVKALVRIMDPNIVRWLLFAMMLICFAISAVILKGKNAGEIVKLQKEKGYTIGFTILLALGFAWSLVSLSEVSTFLYFNF